MSEKIKLTKYELERLRKASEGRTRLTKQLYDTTQNIFKWLDEVLGNNTIKLEIPMKDPNDGNSKLERVLNILDYEFQWFWNGARIDIPYDVWMNSETTLQLTKVLSRDDLLELTSHIDVIIYNIRNFFEIEQKKLYSALNTVKKSINEVFENE